MYVGSNTRPLEDEVAAPVVVVVDPRGGGGADDGSLRLPLLLLFAEGPLAAPVGRGDGVGIVLVIACVEC